MTLARASADLERQASVATSSSTVPHNDLTEEFTDPDPVELSRIATARSQHDATVGGSSTRRTTNEPLPPFGGGKSYPPPFPDQEAYVVEFDGSDDPIHAQNWSSKQKLLTAAMLGFTTAVAAFGSSIFSVASGAVAIEFGISHEVSVLGVSLYVLGFAFGPTLWAPMSELIGRRLPLLISMFGLTIFSIATGVSKDIQSILITRFFAGFCGACPLAVVAAVFSDMYDNKSRGLAITLFSVAVFACPLMAPFVGGFIVDSHLGWRWTQYLMTILAGFIFIVDLLFLKETYPPIILVNKAATLRRLTKNWGIHARQDEIEVSFRELVSKNFTRPMRLLWGEPIVLLLSIYMAFIYGILYLLLTAYPLIFQGIHHFRPGPSGLTFFGMVVGQILSGISVFLQQPWYQRKLAANNNVPVPEWRLPPVIAGGISFTAGIFWLGWTGYREDVHWMVPTASGVLTGFGLLSIFMQAINYLVDAYLMFAASALAGNTFLRSLCGAAFPLFATQMFHNVGIEWACTILGCIAAAMIPIPICFLIWGKRIRGMSHYAPTAKKE